MEISGVGKSPNSSLSFRYNANNEELEELFHVCEDDPPTPQCDPPPGTPVESASPKRGERSSSIIDKYFKSMRSEKVLEKLEDAKPIESKQEEVKAAVPKEVTSSPMKEYLNRLGKRSTPDVTPDVKEGSNETWKLFHDFKFKIAQAVEDMKTRSVEDTKEKSIPRENSASDSEENSAIRDLDKESVGDTDNQVSSLDSSLQNLSDMTQPLTAKATERDPSIPADNKNYSDSSDDTHKNLAFFNEAAEVRKDVLTDAQMEVESGVEALEDTIDSFGDIHNANPLLPSGKPQNLNTDPVPPLPPSVTFGPPPSKNNNKGDKMPSKPNHFCSFSMYFLTFLILISFTLFPNSNIWNGFVFGLWSFCFTSNLKNWVLDTYFSEFEPKSNALIRLKRSSAMPPSYTIPSVKEHTPIKKYEGWINHYRFPDYDPHTYHINKTTTAFMKLEGCNLRISYTSTKIPKRALWDEKLEKVAFYQHRLYNLTGAKVLLMPVGIVKRRQWSKKYPICVILSDNEKIQVLEKETFTAEKRAAEIPLEKKKEQHEMETETNTSANSNTSPEKRRKFVWRRREKSTSHSDGETGKEGLRHRLVRKMHRDKKTDTVSTGTEPVETQSQSAVPSEKAVIDDSFHDRESDLASKSATSTKDDDDDFDDTEMSKIKDLLEETEREIAADGTSEGEWSLHVKYSKDRHSYLFLFGRTGRDKHEWYRRLAIAITDANAASPENSAAEEKSGSEPTTENKDNVEMAVYKVTEKEAVAFNKSSNKTVDSLNDGGGVTITSISQPIPPETDYEKIFWPYLLKIIETHDMSADPTSEKAVMCQIEPTPRDKPKNKKKRKEKDNKNSPSDCNCRLLPSEVTWVNTMMARVMFDMMRDPVMINRLQNRIQRKLNTLKLPAFMSPLVVTELSLVGACPLVERVAVPTWDARGVWLDADIRYDGGAFIAILTQINLMKLKEKNLTLEEQLMQKNVTSIHRMDMDVQTTSASPDHAQQTLRMRKPAIYDSDVEDSAESSDDDESPPVQPVDSMETVSSDTPSSTAVIAETTTSTSSKKKFLRMVDKIATNKYFQQVTDYKYIKRAMEGLSNTDIKLHLEVQALEGRLTFNLPPPPHDRVWLGFRTNPQLVLKARPAVGARTLRFAHITNWIEQKLSKEFEKILVLPNMEDFVIDIMTPTPVQYP